jgi:hypothetical protein
MKIRNARWYHWFVVGFLGAALMNLAACSDSSSGPALGPSCPNNTCGVGVVPQAQESGFYAQTPNMDYYYLNNGSQFIINSQQFIRVLRDFMGTCDRETYNGGLADCGSWMSGFHDITIHASKTTANNVKLIMKSYPNINPSFNYYYNLPGLSEFFAGLTGMPVGNPAGIFNPLVLGMTVNPINNSQGFELRGYGPQYSYAQGTILQIVVPNGKLEDPAFDFAIFINNIAAASNNDLGSAAVHGRMVRCKTANCGR